MATGVVLGSAVFAGLGGLGSGLGTGLSRGLGVWAPIGGVLLAACTQAPDTLARPGESGFDSTTYCSSHPKANGCCWEEARHVIDFEDAAVVTLSPLSNRYASKGVEMISGSAGPYVLTEKFLGNQEGNAAVSGKVALLVGFNKTPVRFVFKNPEVGGKAVTKHVSAMVGDKSPETDLIIMEAFDFNGKKLGADSFQAQPSGKVGDHDFGEVSIDAEGIYFVTVNDTNASGADLDDFTYDCLEYRLH